MKIPKSKRPFVGVHLERGLNCALEKACEKTEMSKGAFIRYSVAKTLQELSLMTELVHSEDTKWSNSACLNKP